MSDGKGGFVHASDKAGDFCTRSEVHRGLAFADLRNRGAIDLVVSNVDNTVRIFRNDAAGKGGHWLQVLPMIGKREAQGAKVIATANGRTRMGLCLRAYSYISSSDPRVHFGLGKAEKVESLEVLWPSGTPSETSSAKRSRLTCCVIMSASRNSARQASPKFATRNALRARSCCGHKLTTMFAAEPRL